MKYLPVFESLSNFSMVKDPIEIEVLQELSNAGVLWNYPFKAWQLVSHMGTKKNYKTLIELMDRIKGPYYADGKIINCKINVVVLYSDSEWGTSMLTSDVTKELGPILKKYEAKLQ